MKILHVNGTISEGGIEQYLAQLFRELDQRGHRSLLLYGDSSGRSAFLSDAKTYYIERVTHFRCRDPFTKLKMVQEILGVEKPDLVYIHQVLNSSLIDLLTKQLPSVRFVHGFKLVCPDGKKTLITIQKTCPYPLGYSCQARAYQYKCMPRNPFIGLPLIYHSRKIAQIHKQRSHMVVASEFMKSVLLYNGFEESKIKVIPYFTYLPEHRAEEAPSSEPLILSLGRIVPAKGMHHLLYALPNIHKNAQLVIAGDGSALNELKALAKKLSISSRVSFPGWLSHDELDKLYRQCSLVVVPSIWPEPFGIVGIEAMAYQKPVIAFDVGGISEWLKNQKAGFLMPSPNEKELAEKVNLLLERRDLADQMGSEGRMLVEKRFSPEKHMEALESLFKGVANQGEK